MYAPLITTTKQEDRLLVFAEGKPVGFLKKAMLRGTQSVWDGYNVAGKRIVTGRSKRKDAINALILDAMGLF